MKVTVISSGSKGNSTLVETKSKNILIDAGISSKEIKKRLKNSHTQIFIKRKDCIFTPIKTP